MPWVEQVERLPNADKKTAPNQQLTLPLRLRTKHAQSHPDGFSWDSGAAVK
jgi:hypothetical protein